MPVTTKAHMLCDKTPTRQAAYDPAAAATTAIIKEIVVIRFQLVVFCAAPRDRSSLSRTILLAFIEVTAKKTTHTETMILFPMSKKTYETLRVHLDKIKCLLSQVKKPVVSAIFVSCVQRLILIEE